ncbi:MAG: hypothetical protein RM368_15320 [Nostoc sp. DedSLP03]|uniref:hypothetical protein n=1 Tax=Nostoc sp. DedSLP03 TaxID=3075400 RepID=UPI002AD55D32|nr:hypothetical protein [Nostoc sp. DedSLP03]MDZ7966323.1 hypothetical protein [Nostoc sp. DedSLP03]
MTLWGNALDKEIWVLNCTDSLLLVIHQHPIHASDTPLGKLRQQFLNDNLQSRIVISAFLQLEVPNQVANPVMMNYEL